MRQTFIADDASHVRTRAGLACVTSRPIDIVASLYRAPDTGLPIDFSEVIRSHAASAQFVATLPDDSQSFRVQLKYSPRPATPITIDTGSGPVDVADMLEPSGDSIRITDPDMLGAIRDRLEGGGAVTLTATSRDTGRRVIDRIEGMRFAAYDACRAGTPPAPDAPPSNRIAFDFVATADPALRATDVEAATCRIADPTAELYRGRLLWTTGFFAQTQDIFVTFSANGEVAEVYVPGIVEGRRRPDGVLATHLSIAANANDPMRPARVSGCLGSAPVALCAEPDGGFGECMGGLAATDLFEDAAFLSNFELGGGAGSTIAGLTPPGGLATPFGMPVPSGTRRSAGPGGGGFGGGIPTGGGTPRGPTTSGFDPQPPGSPDPDPRDPPVVPLPLSGWLLLTGAVALLGVRRWGRGSPPA